MQGHFGPPILHDIIIFLDIIIDHVFFNVLCPLYTGNSSQR